MVTVGKGGEGVIVKGARVLDEYQNGAGNSAKWQWRMGLTAFDRFERSQCARITATDQRVIVDGNRF
jgi:hypothetical protein